MEANLWSGIISQHTEHNKNGRCLHALRSDIATLKSSVRELPIPDVVFEAILKERKQYEANRRRRSTTFQDLDYICCSTYGRPRSKNYHWQHYKKLLADNGLPSRKNQNR